LLVVWSSIGLWVVGYGLGWFLGPKFLLCDGLRWVSSVVWWVGLGWVEELGSGITHLGLPSFWNVSDPRPNSTHQKAKNLDPTRPRPTQPNPTRGSTQPMDNSGCHLWMLLAYRCNMELMLCFRVTTTLVSSNLRAMCIGRLTSDNSDTTPSKT